MNLESILTKMDWTSPSPNVWQKWIRENPQSFERKVVLICVENLVSASMREARAQSKSVPEALMQLARASNLEPWIVLQLKQDAQQIQESL